MPDGDNYSADRPQAEAALRGLADVSNYCGYLEVSSTAQRQLATETGGLFKASARRQAGRQFRGEPHEDIWEAVRHSSSSRRATRSERKSQRMARVLPRIEQLAVSAGLNYNPVDFEEVPDAFMMEISVYGLPGALPHWSFGCPLHLPVVQHRMGPFTAVEVVFPATPARLSRQQQQRRGEHPGCGTLLGHADFSRNNLLFRRSQQQVGENIVGARRQSRAPDRPCNR